MWSCEYMPFSGGWWNGFAPGNLWALVLWSMFILLVICLLIRLFKSQTHHSQRSSQDRIDSLSILETRFARGEISREDFIKVKQILY